MICIYVWLGETGIRKVYHLARERVSASFLHTYSLSTISRENGEERNRRREREEAPRRRGCVFWTILGFSKNCRCG